MKKLLFALAAALTLPLAAHADIAYYYGTVSVLGFDSSNDPSSGLAYVVAVVDYRSNQMQLIAIGKSTTPNVPFTFKNGPVQNVPIVSLTSPSGVSYTYFALTLDTTSGTALNQEQYLLYGANKQISLLATNEPAPIPASLTGTDLHLQQDTASLDGSVNLTSFNLALLLPVSQAENKAGRTFMQAVQDVDTYFTGLKGQQK